MIMPPALRKFTLTIHVTCSLAWIGAVLAYLVLVIAAMTKQDIQTLRAAWLAMDLIAWFAIVPASLAALVTGIVMSLGTKWGLFRHYWVLLSLALTIFAILVLLQHMQTVSYLANLAANADSGEISELRDGLSSELFHAGIGLLVLLVIQVLNVYKPRGLTRYGWQKQQEQRMLSQP